MRERANGASSSSSARSRDRFDNLPKQRRIGSHRIVAKPRRFWVYALSALIGIALLTGAGVVTLMVTGANVNKLVENWGNETDGIVLPGTPSAQAELRPDAHVAVLNGTTMRGFGALVDELITENSWGTVVFSGDAATDEVEISAVFYTDPADESAALGLAAELGGVGAFQSDVYTQFGSQLTVLLGSDYAGPGSEQFSAGGSFVPETGLLE